VYLEENKVKEAAVLWEKAYKMTSSPLLLHRLEDFTSSRENLARP